MRHYLKLRGQRFKLTWIAIIVLVSILPVILGSIFLLRFSMNQVIQEKRKFGETLKSSLKSVLLEDFSYLDYSSISQKLLNLKESAKLNYIQALDSEEQIIFDSEGIFEKRAANHTQDGIIQFTTKLENTSGTFLGEIRFGIDFQEVHSNKKTITIFISLLGFIICLVEGLLIFFAISKLISPFEYIFSRFKQLSQGRFEPITKFIKCNDERSMLNNDYNKIVNDFLTYEKKIQENSRLAAIGQTTRLLAHDVRKPFSILKLILQSFDRLKNEPSFFEKSKKEVSKAINHVESMISDIMNFSREMKLQTSPVSLFSIIDYAIKQSCQERHEQEISFQYELHHRLKPLADSERLARVFINLFSNAVEAILDMDKKQNGIIYIHSNMLLKDKKRNMVEIVVGNTGPRVHEKDIPNLFASFFTKGKKKGTGLGLASAKRIMDLHNGSIEARNRKKQTGIEFVLKVPASGEKDTLLPSHNLPSNIKDIASKEPEWANVEEPEPTKMEGNHYHVLLLEDESLYRAAIRHLIIENETLNRLVRLYEAQTVDEAVKLVKTESIDHAIVDIDLHDSKNGYDFLSLIKDEKMELKCLVHSNRCLQEDKQKALDLGAVGFIPKPLRQAQLISFLLGMNQGPHEASSHRTNHYTAKTLLFCDDNKLNRYILAETVKSDLPDWKCYIFRNGEELLAKLRKMGGCNAIFSDQYMGKGITGLELIKIIKKEKLANRCYIVTNEQGEAFRAYAKQAGADDYFIAPLESHSLKKLVSLLS